MNAALDELQQARATGGGSGGGAGFALGPFSGSFTAPTPRALPTLPAVPNAPTYAFTPPTAAEALNDPGYQFRTQQGQGVLERSAAAKGILNDSGTGKALIDYGQNAASAEYSNLWNRDFNAYNASYAPQFATWQAGNARADLGYTTDTATTQHTNDLDYQNAWQKFLNEQDFWKWNVNGAIGLAGS